MPKFLKNLFKDQAATTSTIVVFGAIGAALWGAYKANADAQAAAAAQASAEAAAARMTAPIGTPKGMVMTTEV